MCQADQRLTVRIRRLDPKARIPRRQTEGASGWDLHARLDEPLEIPSGGRRAVPTGLAVAVPAGYELQVRPRSGLALHHGIGVLNAPGTIDEDYRGEIRVIIANFGNEPFRVEDGDRIAQMVLASVPRAEIVEVDDLEPTARGPEGFGHTGRRDPEVENKEGPG